MADTRWSRRRSYLSLVTPLLSTNALDGHKSRFSREMFMASVIPRRVTAQIDGDFVVFLIGMRVNNPWKIHKWLPVFRAMPAMIRELEARPESGFLGHVMTLGVIVQYWRSFEQLEAYARDQNQLHWPAWVDFNRRVGGGRGDVGILARDIQSPRRRV